ncbi:hypothetical protein XCV3533 [Xanthomonas euvesicatoria pv. vesicatoria str. 85-10]|uniref:Uncharacterized protein n=1 Tax=Xanthomonas euvesicatoria pv. vesicatoria (strain 85-10) TaxID=316273 RepID=Q3BPP9_XANE5|nr:hypothetical protein XCV3533 [Xanthomonas euvesicatoria pv. vesicatoria str. 85-10]
MWEQRSRRFPHRSITRFSGHSLVVPGKCHHEAIGSSVAAHATTRSVGRQPTFWCGVLAACGTVGGMDAAIEPPRTDLRRLPQAARAPRARRTWFFTQAMQRNEKRAVFKSIEALG